MKKKIKKRISVVFIALFALSSMAFNSHEYFFSLTQINQNVQDNTLDISVKIDAEHLVQAAGSITPDPIDLDNEERTTPILKQYIESHQVWKENGTKRMTPYFVGYEVSEDMHYIYCYQSYSIKENVSKITFGNHLFIDISDHQKNLVEYSISNIATPANIEDNQHVLKLK